MAISTKTQTIQQLVDKRPPGDKTERNPPRGIDMRDRDMLEGPEADIRVGAATLKAHLDGGWALPGGGSVDSLDAAQEQARELDSVIQGLDAARAAARVTARAIRRARGHRS